MAWYKCTGSVGGSRQATIAFQSDITGSWNASAGDERNMLTITATGTTTIAFGSACTGRTNCSNNDGYIEIRKNGTAVHSVTLPANTTTNIGTIPNISLNAGDVCTLVFGFAGSHTNINMHFYNGELQIDGNVEIAVTNASKSTVTMESVSLN